MPPPRALGAEEIMVLETWIRSLKKLPVPSSTASKPDANRPFNTPTS